MIIGLTGAHRTGKTTLAKRFAEVAGYRFVETSVSATFKKHGMDPRVDYPVSQRLWIQRQILQDLTEIYQANRHFVVVDRTPVDLAAYMLADITRQSVDPYTDKEVMAYVDECLALTKKFFDAVIIIQPGIPIVEDETKAPATESYMEHINVICLGLAASAKLQTTSMYSVSRSCTELDERCEALVNIVANMPNSPSMIPFKQKLPM